MSVYLEIWTNPLKNDQILHMIWQTFAEVGGAPKSLQMLTAAIKLKDTCSLEEKLWPT